jgi:predicted PurR-regulated permease PerM
MVLAKGVLIPLSMALLISFILFPVVKKLEGWGLNALLAAFISLLLLVGVITGKHHSFLQ